MSAAREQPARRPAHDPADAGFAALFGAAVADLPGGARLSALRETGFARFAERGFPNPRAEDWKYSGLARLVNRPLVRARAPALPLPAGGAELRVTLVNGLVQPFRAEALPAGVAIHDLAALAAESPARVEALVGALADDGRGLTALNTALFEGGLLIELDDGAVLDRPLRLDFISLGGALPSLASPRCFVRLGAGAELHLVERHHGEGGALSFTNLVIEARLEHGARLVHDRLQRLPAAAALASKLHVELACGAKLVQTVATMGGALVRNETEVRIRGAGVECLLNGAFLSTGEEQADTLIRVHHEAPDSHSDQFYKGVIDGRSRAAFQGKVIVHEDAQKTNAFQRNNNLLLSNDAELDAKPELEIYADDVKCSHGATSGDLDPQALFYMRSRGIEAATARGLLTFAFAAELFDRFGDTALRDEARQAATARLPGAAAVLEAA